MWAWFFLKFHSSIGGLGHNGYLSCDDWDHRVHGPAPIGSKSELLCSASSTSTPMWIFVTF